MPQRSEITAEYASGDVIEVEQHDGTFLRLRKMAASTGTTLIAQRCTVEWSTKTPRCCIISSTRRRLNG
jgi:hypothetical protein